MPAISDLIAGDFHVGPYRQKAGTVAFPGNVTVAGDMDSSGSTFSADQQVELVTGNKTLDIGDNGVIQRVTATATITLPSTVVGYRYIIENGGSNGTVTINVSPAAADMIVGNGFTGADNKDAINTLGNKGDRIVLQGDGVNGWMCAEVRGLWTREA